MAYDKIPPVLEPGTPADFTLLSPEKFEDLCELLVRKQPGVIAADKHGTRGQADRAVDVLARREDGSHDLYQCKNYRNYTIKNLDDHIEKFITALPGWCAQAPIGTYVLIISSKLEDTALHQAIDKHTITLLREYKIAFQVWSGGTIETKLAPHPEIVRRFFDEYWVKRLCPMFHQPGIKNRNCLQLGKLALLKVLSSLPININKIRSVLQQFTSEQDAYSDTIYNLIESLDSYPLPNPNLSNTDLFVVQLTSMCKRQINTIDKSCEAYHNYHEAYQKLNDWLDEWPRKYAAPAIIAEQERLAEAHRRSNSTPIIILKPFDEIHARAWHYSDGEWKLINFKEAAPDALPAFRRWLTDAINKVSGISGIQNHTVIELVLPLKKIVKSFLGLPIKIAQDINYELGEPSLPLVLRLQERWHGDKNTTNYYNNLSKEWGYIQPKLDTLPRVRWHSAPNEISTDRWQWLATFNTKVNEKNFQKAIINGAPFAVWCDPEDISYIEYHFQKSTYWDFHSYFQQIGNLSPDHKPIHCLIDDPNRPPPGNLLTTHISVK